MEIEHVWMHGADVILKFKGIDTISDAERLRGCDVVIPFSERAELSEGEYYQSDLVGCEVTSSDGRLLGVVMDWQETGGTPLVEVRRPDGKDLLVPFAKSIFTKIDLEQRRIEVDLPEGLEDLNNG